MARMGRPPGSKTKNLSTPEQVQTAREKRFWAKVIAGGPGECWEWDGAHDPKGYARFFWPEASFRAYRAVLLLSGIPLIEGADIDHTCLNKGCVNPDHLEQVTPAENRRRMHMNKKAA